MSVDLLLLLQYLANLYPAWIGALYVILLVLQRAYQGEICEFLCGKVVQIKDVIRHDKRVVGEGSVRPRPVLVKFTTVWDKRLILCSPGPVPGGPGEQAPSTGHSCW